jgi:hypothetical protein
MFRQVVGSLFALAGRYVGQWYDTEGLDDVPTYGFRAAVSPEEVRIRSGRLTWRFIEGYLKYEHVWREVLSPHTLGGVTRASEEAGDKTEGFVLPAELWAHIVYDYLVAFNAAERDVSLLLDSLIPLYFARTATFVHEASTDDHDQAEERISGFADLFLARKQYLRDRWNEVGRKRSLAEQTVTPHGEEHEGMTEGELGSQTV